MMSQRMQFENFGLYCYSVSRWKLSGNPLKTLLRPFVCMYVCTSLFSVFFLHYTFENIFYLFTPPLCLPSDFVFYYCFSGLHFRQLFEVSRLFFDYFIRLGAWALHILISCDLLIFFRVYYLWDRIRRSIRYLRGWGVVGLAAIVIISRWGWDFYFFSVSWSGVDSRPPGAPGLLPFEFVCHPIGFGA